MNNDTALILMLADRQRDIEGLRARVAELEQEVADLTDVRDEMARNLAAAEQ